ncbi:MBL fold metallo-hydrolase [Butyrivibrio sp. CB08]|uniref:MBL fold metallo-hydrolase n=1 Tax=Butyrivibrio sp. CB08 TaxID=2364879 RepID=UPI000EA866DE|nr:MBL fold metallo-hydrolase [Butyrivibrio sp. CB08]RKM57915.1 MBL fold metallo-hydrolase [Butyrivibrio sp. CB08]
MTNEKSTNKISLHVLGCRGSMPVSGPEYVEFGGATSSYLYMTETEAIILDAGTGIMNMPDIGDRNVTIIITHAHIDHVLGLPMYVATLGAKELTIAGASHEGRTIRQQLDTYIKRPLWPVSLDIFPAKINYIDVKEDASAFQIGPVTITAIPANHPGGSTIYKLECDGTTLVYATDFEHEELPDDRKDSGLIPPYSTEPLKTLIDFSQGADLVLYDAQYTPEEYPGCKTFGHSTCEKANELRTTAGVKEMILVHHAPNHSDAFLNGMENAMHDIYNCASNEMRLAREGDEITIK